MSSKMIPLFKVFMAETAGEAVSQVLQSGYIGQGPKVAELENQFKDWFNNDFVLTLNSATSGLHLALHLLKNKYTRHDGSIWPGINSEDEVLCTSLTCTASNFPVRANNLRIKWVDVDPTTFNMDLDDLARKISPTTKAIIVVHWAGYPLDLDKLKEIQNRAYQMYGFKPAIIEDCAHAMGSTYKNKKLGNHGNICVYSLQAIKHLTSGDGGLIIFPHQHLYNRAKLLRWYGIDRETNRKDFRCEADIPEWGFKFHMNDINAAICLENLKHIEDILEKHRNNAQFYNQQLKDVDKVTLLDYSSDRSSVYWVYSFKVKDRDAFMEHMKKSNIMVSQVHARNDIHSCIKEFRSQLPSLDAIEQEVVSIPVGWWVTEDQRQYIVDCIKKGW